MKVNLCDLGFGSGFLDRTPRVWTTTAKQINWTFQNENLSATEDIIKKMKKKIMVGKTFGNNISDQPLISRIHKKLLLLQ